MNHTLSKSERTSTSAHLYEAFFECFQNPTRENFRRFLTSHIGEKDFVDFKSSWPEYSALAKHLLAMGNSGGGAIVIGIKEEQDAHTLTPVGINSPIDTADVSKGIQKYIPSTLLKSIDVIQFAYKASEYGDIEGKTFQMVLVTPDVEHTPFLSRKAGTAITADAIYIRRGTRTELANHDEMQALLNQRIETRYSTSKEISLGEHLGQLKILYSQIPRTLAESPAITRMLSSFKLSADLLKSVPNPEYPKEEFADFVTKCIENKKKRIESELGL